MRPVPVGVPGELYVGGAGLGRGYLSRPELTVEKFVSDPFSDRPDARLYRTGDLVRYLPDGSLEYLGRIDHQVKIRGFRIELGEIETVLAQHPAIRETLVLVREDEPGEKTLVAYLIMREGRRIPTDELRRFLKEQLPEYMVPATFISLDSFPLTENGKIDRRALPAPAGLRPDLEAAYVAPRTEAERTIAVIWQELLHLERVGLYDNFFDLGGHSLLITQLYSKLKRAFRKEISIVDLFKYPTVSALAKYFSDDRSKTPAKAEKDSEDRFSIAKSRLQQLSERRQQARARGE
jgi:acyl carrier protein